MSVFAGMMIASMAAMKSHEERIDALEHRFATIECTNRGGVVETFAKSNYCFTNPVDNHDGNGKGYMKSYILQDNQWVREYPADNF